jgi:two-component system, OmpR family, response regulator ResD
MQKILIADDDNAIRKTVSAYCRYEGFEVTEAKDGLEAVELCTIQDFDVIIMDVMMPKLDGFSACKEIRAFKNTPIIMLTALGMEYDKLHGFDVGVSDYVVKPFSSKELVMRIKAISRLMNGNKDILEIGDLKIDFTAKTVRIGTEEIRLSPKVADLLFYMAKNNGIALTREALICSIWGYDYKGDERTLDAHIKTLRKDLREYSRCISTIKGVGYRFDAE